MAPREDPGAVETFGTAEPSLVRPKVDVEGAEPAQKIGGFQGDQNPAGFGKLGKAGLLFLVLF